MSDELTVVVWDVQHGHAVYVGSPLGEHVAIDAGRGSTGTGGDAFSPLRWLRDRWGVQQLDGAVITHPHHDHVADLPNLKAMRPRVLYRARVPGDDDEFDAWQQTYTAPITGHDPLACDVSGYRVQTFVPTRCPESNLNNRSIVTVASYAGTKLLIPGSPSRHSLSVWSGSSSVRCSAARWPRSGRPSVSPSTRSTCAL
jgi:beta-lactamase superfamily II metal-dependent hydrolase